MRMFPHTVTLVDVERVRDGEDYTRDRAVSHITILRGVLLNEGRGIGLRAGGTVNQGGADLYVPFTVEAVDGLSGERKRYASPAQFQREADKDRVWTLRPGDGCFFIRGEAAAPEESYEAARAGRDGVYQVAEVVRKDYGSPGMRHFEIRGR